jgi:hypothetical protein
VCRVRAPVRDYSFGLGFRIHGLGFRVQGLGFRIQGLGFGTQGSTTPGLGDLLASPLRTWAGPEATPGEGLGCFKLRD